jgi:hypothetical protein
MATKKSVKGYGLSAGRRDRRRILRRQPFVIIGQVGDAFGDVTWALVVRYGELLVSERRPKNWQQLSVAVPKIEHPGA